MTIRRRPSARPGPILLTAFGPFGPFRKNPTEIVLRRILASGEPGVEGLCLPVVRREMPRILRKRLRRGGLSAVVLTGLAAERSAVSIERIAINLLDFTIPDEEGARVRDVPVVRGGPLALPSTAPVRALREAVLRAGVPCVLSMSAGTYLCNQAYYLALHELSGSGVPVVFVHVPPASELVAEGPERPGPVPASLPLEAIERAIRAVLGALPRPARLDRKNRPG